MRRAGQVSPEFTTAARTRSRDSARAASGSPTSETPGRPWPMSASISTTSPSTPRSPIDHAHASATSERPLVVLDLRLRLGREQHRDDVEAHLREPGAPGGVPLGEPALREAADTGGLDVGDGLGRPVAGARARLHLGDDEAVPRRGDEVELALPAAPVAVEHDH